MLQGSDGIELLRKHNDFLEEKLWAKHVFFECHIVHFFDKMAKRKMWAHWLNNVMLERKGLKIMRRMLIRSAWKALLLWEAHCRHEKHLRMVGAKLLKQWQNKQLLPAFHSFVQTRFSAKRCVWSVRI